MEDGELNIIETLDGKNCVITGGTRGLGEATAKIFAKLGANVLITGRDEDRGNRIQRSIKGITFHKADLEKRQDILDLVDWLDKNFGEVDVLISNAGRSSRFDLMSLEIQEWDKMQNLLLTAPFLLSRWAARRMIEKQKAGKILIVGAIQAISPLDRSFAYSTCKGGLISMVRSMAVDLGRYGILVTGVLPGPIYVKDEPISPEFDASAATVLGRMGRPSEFGKVVAFLASDNNTFMTGNVVVVDGGRLVSRKPDPTEIQTEFLPIS
jgi:glucose 1-dehydrogenase